MLDFKLTAVEWKIFFKQFDTDVSFVFIIVPSTICNIPFNDFISITFTCKVVFLHYRAFKICLFTTRR